MSTHSKKPMSYEEVIQLVSEDKRDIARSIASELSFMATTMSSLKKHVAEHGAVEWYENGRQGCWRESPALKSYNAMVQRYSNLTKQLVGLMPADVAEEGDELDAFLNAGI